MDPKTINTLLMIASAGLGVAALIFILISIFADPETNSVLTAGLACVALASLFNIIRLMLIKKNNGRK